MAYVNRDRSDESAQVIILAGFLVAIGIVVIAVFLNGLIFAQDLATRGEGADYRQIAGFEQYTERTAEEVARAVGSNDTGNITEDDLFTDTGDVADNYEASMETYGAYANRHLESRQAVAEVPNSSVDIDEKDTVWSVGQRKKAPLRNESGDEAFKIVETDDDGVDDEFDTNTESFRMNVEVEGSTLEDFGVLAVEPGIGVPADPPGDPEALGGSWRLEFNTTKSTNQMVINDTSNIETSATNSNYDWEANAPLNFTLTMYPRKRQANLSVDGSQLGDGSSLELDEFGDSQSLFLYGDMDIKSGYEIRFDGGSIEDTSEILGPCNSPPCVAMNPNGYNSEMHVVAVVDNGSFKYRYYDGDAEYASEVENISTSQDELPLGRVDG